MFRLVGVAFRAAGFAFLAILFVLAGVVIAHGVGVFRDNHTYAADVFANLVSYDRVLASRFSRGFSVTNGCAFAIVELSADAPDAPPSRTGTTYGRNFGGEWKRGPSPWFNPSNSTTRRERPKSGYYILEDCTERNWSTELEERLKAAARDPASWWIDGFGNQLYSKKHRLAALVYYRPL